MPTAVKGGGGRFLGNRSALWFPIHSTGEWAIRWLTACLTISPLMILLGNRRIRRYRKLFGVYAFIYAGFHLFFFVADQGLIAILSELNFALGLMALAIMLPLALTSNRWSLRRLKKAWRKLHQWVYIAAILAVLHVALLERGSWMPYAIITAVGFLLRLPAIKRFSGFSLGNALPQRWQI